MSDLSLIKKLRESTGCGISDCSKALSECGGDFEKSVDWLRKKGLSSAVKKSGRVTSEGLIGVLVDDNNKGTIIELNSETDFVARNHKFQEFARNLISIAGSFGDDVEKFKSSKYLKSGVSVEEELKNQIGVIGENINIRRIGNLFLEKGVIVSYVHNVIAQNLGKIGVLVAIESDSSNKDKLIEFGKKIAMHIAATRPESVTVESLDGSKLKREIEVLREQAKNSGKPENIIEKMMEGRVRKYYEEVVLMEQNFVMDDKIKIKDLIANIAKEISSPVKINGFKLFILGEGIEKKENDFASEVFSIKK